MLKSTRSKEQVTASYAILKGLSKDGGLFVFDTINPFFYNESLTTSTYTETAFKVLKVFLDSFTDSQIKQVIKDSYNSKAFKPEVVSLDTVNNHTYLKLYNGNTFAFKDLALSILPNLYKESKKIEDINNKTIILTATSGDTGSAALSGFNTLEDEYVIVLYPADGVSAFQELQMKSFESDHCFVLPIDGNFDDCQRIVKELFMNVKTTNVNLSSANSINIGRIIPQIVYYVYSYSQLVSKKVITYGEKIDVTVPTGNFGNIYAAYVAKKMGVPIDNLVIASNSNNVLTELFKTGVYDTTKTLHKTISPSMDILVSSNFERYLSHLYEGDDSLVSKDMKKLKETGKVSIDILNNQKDFYCYFATEEETKATIKETYKEEQRVIDPHTAVARCCYDKYTEEVQSTNHMLIASTASPFKFTESMLDIFDIESTKDLLKDFEALSTFGNLEIDKRLHTVLNTMFDKTVIKNEVAFDVIRKIIGDIDVKN